MASSASDDALGGDKWAARPTFLQFLLAYMLLILTTLTLNSESIYGWEAEHWSVPVKSGPEGWGLRFAYTLIFPKVKRWRSFRSSGRWPRHCRA